MLYRNPKSLYPVTPWGNNSANFPSAADIGRELNDKTAK